MSLKKAICPICNSENHHPRIFDVNPESEICYCPTCLTKLTPIDAVKAYDKMMRKRIFKADSCLFDYEDSYQAYCYYASLIDVDPELDSPYYGRMLALIRMSTVKRPMIKLTGELLIRDKEILLKKAKKNNHHLLLFLRRIDYYLPFYLKKLKRRLTFGKHFYDLKCLAIFLTACYDSQNLIETCLSYLELTNPDIENESYKFVVHALKNDLKKIQAEIAPTVSHPLLNGSYYMAYEFDNESRPVFKKSNYSSRKSIIQPHHRNKDYLKYIPNKMFHNNSWRVKFYQAAFFLMGILLIVACVLLVLYFIRENTNDFALLIVASVFFVLSAIIFLYRVYIYFELKRRVSLLHYHSKFVKDYSQASIKDNKKKK